MTNTTQATAATTTEVKYASMERFIAGKKARNADIDVILQDVRDNRLSLATIIDEAMDHQEDIYVVDSSIKKAKEAAAALNELYAVEYKKAQQAQSQLFKSMMEKKEKQEQKEEAKALENPKKMVDNTFEEKQSILKTEEAQAFMNKHSAPLKNAQTAPVNKNKLEEEKAMTNTNVTMGNTAPAKQEEEKAMTTTNTEVKAQEEKVAPARRRLSTESEEVAPATGGTRRVLGEGRLGRTDSIRQQFVKHEGPWYLNADLYPVLERFEAVLNTMSDAELGIQNIVLVDPSQMKRYDRKTDVYVVIQVMSNGVVLEFPIKQSKSQTSKSDLSSTSIGWVPMKNGMRPAFGFYRSNFPVVTATCSCGKKMENVSASNLYCFDCKTRHNDAAVSITHATLGLAVEEFAFQTVPNMEVPRDLLALVMAIAQYDAGFPMHGVIAE